MENNNFIDQVRRLIAKDEIDSVLQKLQLFLKDSPRLSDAIQQSGRFAALQRQILKGVIDERDAALSRNQIRASILALLDEMEGKGSDTNIQAVMKDPTLIQQAEKIYNIGHIDKADFS